MTIEVEQLLAIIGLAFCAGVIFTIIYDSYAR